MKNKDQRKHFLLYANIYSRELLEDYITQYNLPDYELINIGLGSHKTSRFCTVNKGWYSASLLVSRLFRSIKARVKNGECISIVVPCTNHLMAGMLIAFAKRNPEYVQLDHVVEGTLNYCNRNYTIKELSLPEIYRLSVARLIKKCLSFIFGFVYDLSFSDNVDLPIKSSVLICRKKEGLVSNARLLKVIPLSNYASRRISNPSSLSPILAIVGSHIIESYLGKDLHKRKNFLKPLSNRLKVLPVDFDRLNIVYLPHPRSVLGGVVELKGVYSSLNLSVVTCKLGAKAYILEKNPAHVMCLGGSSLFMELLARDFNGDLIAWGFNELSELGCTQADRLLAVQCGLGVKIY
ncbi:MAG: hypothetical protein P8O79_14335 [Halieaceae bacterium]|nr:hypothetical protein [Halieaceae bacterium]